ncbi:MAG: glycoside hydrolase family 2 TIM barrel-domain containing protein [Bryobacterales bacterium]|nr:glycoside hydrolase family 2 TIM barrel-domain containing protein [Bryobacterales bacterium]
MTRWFALVLCAGKLAAQVWTVIVEEPTGLYRRTEEVVTVPLAKLGGVRAGFRIADAEGQEVPWQVAADELLFPVSLMPGELPRYRIACCEAAPAEFANRIVARRIGQRRLEVGNSFFWLVLDLSRGAVVEAYHLRTGDHRSLNLVETTPEEPEALRVDIHAAQAKPWPPTPASGPNVGWISLGASGPYTRADFVESGPLRGRLRLERDGEISEMVWTATSPVLRWKARRGFRFASISALPFLPFDRFAAVSERDWPQGPGFEEPPDSLIAPRSLSKLPDGHGVYYQREADYGALGILALDAELEFVGIGSRRFEAMRRDNGETEIALSFPRWRGDATLLEARRENTVLRHPVLVRVETESGEAPRVLREAARSPRPAVLRGAPPPAAFVPHAVSLDGEWELAWGEKGAGPRSEWRRVRVPGSVHTQWLPAEQWYTREAEWLSRKEWWYRKRFRLPESFRSKRLRLQFDATDYYADVWLNGRYLGRHEGYIDPYEYDVTGVAQPDSENELRVRLWTPVTYYWKHRPYTIKGSYGAVDQKPDEITALGITRSVRIVASDGAVVRDVAVTTELNGPKARVEVTVSAELHGQSSRWRLALWPRNFSSAETYTLEAPAPEGETRFVFEVENPQLWWTWDHGRPNLYNLDVRLLDAAGRVTDARRLAIGIRELEKDEWIFYLNRRRIFVRGTNYYYGNLYLSEMDRAGYERDLALMLGMNVNMIRLHGHFANPEFYELADEKGVLVWQDFLEAWYPHDRAFSVRAAALYDRHIRLVRNHPSVAIWATSDEEDLENYADLTKHLAARLFFLDPQRRPVVRSTGRYGDAHLYYGWYGGSIWEYAKLTERFVSEFGATALPNYESLIRYLPERFWPIREHAAEWTFRRLQIPEAMQAWGEPGERSLRDYIEHTQEYAARLFQLGLERMRRRKYESGGVLHFHAIDFWPSVTMAAVDFYRVPTKVYDTVRRSLAPLAVSFEYDRDRWRVGEKVRVRLWIVNDLWASVPGASVRWKIRDAKGVERARGQLSRDVGADSVLDLGEVEWEPEASGRYELQAEIRDAKGVLRADNLYAFRVE